MADAITYFGDISPRTAGYTAPGLLKRALPLMPSEMIAQQKPLPQKSTRIMKFRRYKSLTRVTAPLAEGVTPDAEVLTYEDVQCTLDQWGKLVKITDVIQDTHEDPVLQESRDLVGEIMAQSLEVNRYGIFKAGTQVYRASYAAARNLVATVVDRGVFRKAERLLADNYAKKFTQIIKATPNIATEPVAASFFAFCHSDGKADIESLPGFVPVEKYSQADQAKQGEWGKVGSIRFIEAPLLEPWLAGGAAIGATGLISAGAANVDVYPILIFAPDAVGIVPMKGKNAVHIVVINSDKPDKSDPLGQRGYVGAKHWETALILQDDFLVRIETGFTNNPT